MAKLNKKEFQNMKKLALKQLRHIVLGYDMGISADENGDIKICKGYEHIEVLNHPFFTARIAVTGNGFECVNIYEQDAMFLENYINVLKELVYEIIRSKHNPNSFDKEKIKEAYFVIQNLNSYITKLYQIVESDS